MQINSMVRYIVDMHVPVLHSIYIGCVEVEGIHCISIEDIHGNGNACVCAC